MTKAALLLPFLLLLSCAEGGDQNLGPPPGPGSACRTPSDCAPGNVCLFWSPGCDIDGVCAEMCPALDACIGCNEHCGCNDVSFDGCAAQPFKSRGHCPGSVPSSDAG